MDYLSRLYYPLQEYTIRATRRPAKIFTYNSSNGNGLSNFIRQTFNNGNKQQQRTALRLSKKFARIRKSNPTQYENTKGMYNMAAGGYSPDSHMIGFNQQKTGADHKGFVNANGNKIHIKDTPVGKHELEHFKQALEARKLGKGGKKRANKIFKLYANQTTDTNGALNPTKYTNHPLEISANKAGLDQDQSKHRKGIIKDMVRFKNSDLYKSKYAGKGDQGVGLITSMNFKQAGVTGRDLTGQEVKIHKDESSLPPSVLAKIRRNRERKN